MTSTQHGQFRSIPANERLGLTRVEAAEYIGVGITTFDDLVKDGRMPQPYRLNSRVVWSRRAIEHAFDNLPSVNSVAQSRDSGDDLTIA